MSFWNLKTLKLDEFRPGIFSKIESGKSLTMALMEIAPHQEGTAHDHPFDQCGIVVEGEIEIFIGEEKKLLKSADAYFIPAGVTHHWKTHTTLAKILDIVAK